MERWRDGAGGGLYTSYRGRPWLDRRAGEGRPERAGVVSRRPISRRLELSGRSPCPPRHRGPPRMRQPCWRFRGAHSRRPCARARLTTSSFHLRFRRRGAASTFHHPITARQSPRLSGAVRSMSLKGLVTKAAMHSTHGWSMVPARMRLWIYICGWTAQSPPHAPSARKPQKFSASLPPRLRDIPLAATATATAETPHR